jgi:uncharacterized membrane protein YoaK (UPF0700 family)
MVEFKAGLAKQQSQTVVTANGMLCTAVVGALLNLIAGFVNSCAWAEFGASTTHVTGIATVSAMSLMNKQYTKFGELLLQLFLFIAGAFCSSIAVGDQQKFHVGPYYSAVLAAVSLLILSASFITNVRLVLLVISFAAGMQNSLATFFSGAAVRTTHVTGTATDIGIELASYLMGRKSANTAKLRLLIYFLFSFFAGAFLGTGGAALWGQQALILPSGLSMVLAVASLRYYYWHKSKLGQRSRKIQVIVDGDTHIEHYDVEVGELRSVRKVAGKGFVLADDGPIMQSIDHGPIMQSMRKRREEEEGETPGGDPVEETEVTLVPVEETEVTLVSRVSPRVLAPIPMPLTTVLA